MTDHDHQNNETATPAYVRRPPRGRAKMAAGAAGLAVVLGIGAYAVTDKLVEPDDPMADRVAPAQVPVAAPPEPSTPEPSTPAAAPSVSKASSPPPTSPSPAATSATPTPSLPAKVAASIKAAREKMAKDGVQVKHPPLLQQTIAPVVGLSRTTVGTLKNGGIVRVVSARSDLTGQQELAWVAGGITEHGADKCSQTVKLYNKPQPEKKANLLLCWRTSATKSVVAVVVDPQGRPSTPKALAELDKKWMSMR